MTKAEKAARVALAFDVWLARYEANPEAFEREIVTMQKLAAERRAGKPLTYGQACATYLQSLIDDPKLAIPRKRKARR